LNKKFGKVRQSLKLKDELAEKYLPKTDKFNIFAIHIINESYSFELLSSKQKLIGLGKFVIIFIC